LFMSSPLAALMKKAPVHNESGMWPVDQSVCKVR
jgi:hypothetical protein